MKSFSFGGFVVPSVKMYDSSGKKCEKNEF
jgi:hypothetical protein